MAIIPAPKIVDLRLNRGTRRRAAPAPNLSGYTRDQLRAIARDRGRSSHGSKAELIARLSNG